MEVLCIGSFCAAVGLELGSLFVAVVGAVATSLHHQHQKAHHEQRERHHRELRALHEPGRRDERKQERPAGTKALMASGAGMNDQAASAARGRRGHGDGLSLAPMDPMGSGTPRGGTRRKRTTQLQEKDDGD